MRKHCKEKITELWDGLYRSSVNCVLWIGRPRRVSVKNICVWLVLLWRQAVQHLEGLPSLFILVPLPKDGSASKWHKDATALAQEAGY